MSIMEDFSSWKKFLASKVNQAEKIGVNEEAMKSFAQNVGDYLSEHVKPENKEEKLLQELWDVASEEEQRGIAGAMLKLVQQ